MDYTLFDFILKSLGLSSSLFFLQRLKEAQASQKQITVNAGAFIYSQARVVDCNLFVVTLVYNTFTEDSVSTDKTVISIESITSIDEAIASSSIEYTPEETEAI